MKPLALLVLALLPSVLCGGTPDLPAGPLTLAEARRAALANHPSITVAGLRTLVARESTREAQAARLPNLSASVVAVGTARDNTRLAAIGGLNNPAVFERNAEGLVLSQLVTDFGRTANLVEGARLHARAEADNALATRAQLVLAVDAAYHEGLGALAVARVAGQTIVARQLLYDQVSARASNQLSSELDVRFGRVQLDEARLLASKATNDLDAAKARLANLMGLRGPAGFGLVDEETPETPPAAADDLVARALASRPDLLRLRLERDAARRIARAENALGLPTLSAVGSAGVVPVGDPRLPDNYAAAGLTLNMPLFAGGYYSARRKEAALKAQVADELLRDAENGAIRDVRITAMNMANALERLRIAKDLAENARLAFELARARYTAGASSFVELNQAQLSAVSAEIAEATSRLDYRVQRSLLEYQAGVPRQAAGIPRRPHANPGADGRYAPGQGSTDSP